MPGKRMTEDEIRCVCEWVADGCPLMQIAARLKRERSTIKKLVKRIGLRGWVTAPGRPAKPRPVPVELAALTPGQIASIEEMIVNARSTDLIARRMGLEPSVITAVRVERRRRVQRERERRVLQEAREPAQERPQYQVREPDYGYRCDGKLIEALKSLPRYADVAPSALDAEDAAWAARCKVPSLREMARAAA